MNQEKAWLKQYPEFLTNDIEVPNQTLPEMLGKKAVTYPDAHATSFYGQKLTYKELVAAIDSFASSLQASGVEKGDRVAIMLPNCPHYVIAYYGILKAGAVVTQINPMSVDREITYFLNDSGAKAVVVFEALYERVKKSESETVETIIVVSFESSAVPGPDPSFDAFLANGKEEPKAVETNIEDVAVLQYTGGTTSLSKGAMLTHRNLMANVIQNYLFFQEEIEIGQDKTLAVIPLFHVFGMTVCMNLGLYTASEVILLPRFDPEEVLKTIGEQRPGAFPAVPTMYVALNSHPLATKTDISSIKICNSGSAPMPVEVMRSFEEKSGAKILEGYGLSEASPTTHCNPAFAKKKPGSVGIGLPGTDYKVVDLASGENEMKNGDLGEIIIRGPQVMKGYWNKPEETANALRDGWLYTGDIGRIDDEGYLYIVDRKKDMIIASGENIYPRDVEEVLYEHPAIKEAVVIGVPDAYRGETVKAYLVLHEGQTLEPKEVETYCRAHMAAYKIPRIVEFREELPKTNVGKILRKALREEATTNQE
ncbi:long-chain-fatty-acid--CoA ligase [Shouchella shacheensis]|uniref:long-chain-fatty-acid--CoA ligase n=1 Tax=Shouchella shacheensis TaxID=1649580 RepID=UPI000740205A|nr:long-chain fatty acid--CoA ligase [Shouchella shacheensis]